MSGREQGNQPFTGLSFVGKDAECFTSVDHPEKRFRFSSLDPHTATD